MRQKILALNPNPILQNFLNFWLLFFFISSVVLVPSVKGTTPVYLLAFLSFPMVLAFSRYNVVRYLIWLSAFLTIFFFLSLLSQGYIYFFGDHIEQYKGMIFVSQTGTSLFMRPSLFTQFLYLLVSFLIFTFIICFYDSAKHDKYIFGGLNILLVYGFYLLIFFALFGRNGDFLSNRVYGDLLEQSAQFQGTSVAGYIVLRFTSLTGEASMYAFTVSPLFIYAFHTGRNQIAYITLASLALTFSTTFILCFVIYFGWRFLRRGGQDKFVFRFIIAGLLFFLLFSPIILNLLNTMVIEKLTQQNDSGQGRTYSFLIHMYFFVQAPVWVQLFGLGFGYVRSTDFLSTLLVNNGIIGFLLFTALFVYPILKLSKGKRNDGIKIALITLYISMMISVPEFSYPSLWLFLGIAYNQLIREKHAKRFANSY